MIIKLYSLIIEVEIMNTLEKEISKRKIVALQGSFRSAGVTTILLKYASEKLAAAGNEVEYMNLFEKNIGYCKGCRKCLETRECVFKSDDMQEITRKVKEADLIILAAPVYWANVPAVVKNLFDRLLGAAMEETDRFPKPRLQGKKYILITACHTPLVFAKLCGQTGGAIRATKEFFKTAGVKRIGTIICTNSDGAMRINKGATKNPLDKQKKRIDKIIERL